MCILVVEDEALIRMSIEECLSDAGLDFMSADSGHAALTLLAAHPGHFKCLVTDFRMPLEVTGADLIERMRPSYPAIPMVLATAMPNATTPEWRHRHRVKLVLKPYEPADVVELVERLMEPL
jgi:CheY-like chemotaxis protein